MDKTRKVEPSRACRVQIVWLASFFLVKTAAFTSRLSCYHLCTSSSCYVASPRLDHLASHDDSEEPGNLDSDWLQAELTLIQAPSEPSPELAPETVAQTICRSLQWVDNPTESAGLKRCFDFFTFECRKAVTARRGGLTVEAFCEYALLSPALQPFMGAHRVDIGMEDATYTPAQPPFRGALTSIPVTIHGAAIFSLQHASGMERNGVAEPPVTQMVIRLEEQRRPPLQGCWLVREIIDVRYAFAGDMGNAHIGG